MITFDDVCEDEMEGVLLRYIDIPYFRNNPSYISLWQRYYYKTKDPGVLFLMRHKKISRYYHWIYVEFSRFFMKSGHCGMSKAALGMGMACGAYDRKILEDELKGILSSAVPCTEHEANALMNPKGFVALGRVWNSYREILFYNRELFVLDKEEVSFEEYRSRTHTHLPKNGSQRFSYSHEIIEQQQVGDKIDGDPAEGMEGVLDTEQEIVIDGSTYYIKEVIDGKRYRMISIPDGSSETQEDEGDALLHEVPESAVDLILRLNPDHVPRFTVKILGSRTFLFYRLYQLGSLKDCLDVSSSMGSEIVLYFVGQLTGIFNAMEKEGYRFTSFSLESLSVSEDCRLKIVDFDWASDGSGANCGEVIRDILSQYTSFSADQQDIAQRIDDILKRTNMKQVMTKYKIHLYERICGFS
ncbi:hypothetical protein [Encephalitozoon cuniculi GB-M1]|uniref:Protein kinase domain-containing protein n=1 Tax=Encephalitozoon cuniculi (strain GB-M1) TaxID=284813 RepID=Q8SVX8_ENCCU|nr:uncharacterized protein ECU04_0240 [Encephalitozoon cuniculi GB-M1]CAD25211.1 hypothetical protein [Encephalitozoon cuniculi GB-M1]